MLIEKFSQRYRTPGAVQKFIRSLSYNSEKTGETVRSAHAAITAKTAHCLEASFIAAALLERKYPPLIMSLESQDQLDHVLYIYKGPRGWGSISRSRDEGLHGRKAIFKNPKDLARSYIDPYVDSSGRITGYAVINLNKTHFDWRNSKRNLWSLEQYVIDYPHKKVDCSDRHYQALLDLFHSGERIKKQPHWV